MADVVFRRGTAAEISAVPVTDGYILWDTTNNIIYMDNGSKRQIYAVGGSDGIRPIKYGGTGAKDAGTIASSLKLDTLDASTANIGESANLNNYTQAGVYSCPSAGIAATLGNCPFTSNSFVLIVRYAESTSSFIQWLIGCCTSSTNVWYVRNCVNGTFGAWRAICDSSHAHGNITNDGRIGSTANLPIFTGSGGKATTVTAETARDLLDMTMDNLTNVHICATAPSTFTDGHWYLVKED